MTIGVKKITDLPELSSADTNDWIVVTDVSDTSDDGTGKDKKIKVGNLGVGVGGGGNDSAAIHTGDTASGDIGGTFPGPLTINAGAVTLGDMADLPGNTMIGNNTVGLATPVAMSADDVLAFLGLGPISSPIPIADGGTGQTTANASLNALLPSQTSNSGKVLQTNGTNASWAAAASGSFSGLSDVSAGSPANLDLAQYQTSDNKWHNVSGISAAKITSGSVAIANGGTGAATQQAALDALAGAVTTGRVLAGDGTHVTLRALATSDLPPMPASVNDLK